MQCKRIYKKKRQMYNNIYHTKYIMYTYIVCDCDTWLPYLVPPVNIQDA
jgi:hypothetical protein